jgi:hypothetical protein
MTLYNLSLGGPAWRSSEFPVSAFVAVAGQYAAAPPNTELEEFISGFLLTEARKQFSSAQQKNP